MVDYTRIDKITRTQKAAQKAVYYSDFLINLNRHPESNIVVRSTNEEAVKKALRNLLLTNKGERLYQPKIGCDIQNLLFENMSPMTADLLKSKILETIKTHERRVNVLDIVVLPNETSQSYEVGIVFEIINSVDPVTISLTLYRVR
jgi:phage baseplate assembly protein W